ncbi:hypothetical protein EVAR_28078_1 [Eumeta japonica]|uniref:Uncharacterized protein n=1 Tax=Eumeta variegata TaxID=151549 RepID=A0A4C1W8H1_EUMVA|nr:hypothetical protein EVAR_28078_1 [Eumeta japonica]
MSSDPLNVTVDLTNHQQSIELYIISSCRVQVTWPEGVGAGNNGWMLNWVTGPADPLTQNQLWPRYAPASIQGPGLDSVLGPDPGLALDSYSDSHFDSRLQFTFCSIPVSASVLISIPETLMNFV